MLEPLKNVPTFPYLEQYLGLWAIEPNAFSSLLQRVRNMDLVQHMKSASPVSRADVARGDGIARIEIRGSMTKYGSSLSDSGSTVAIRREIRNLGSDQQIGGVFIVWDTPGGTVAGIQELHDDIAWLAKQKPVVSFVEDCCTSAGMFASAPSTKIYANTPGAWVGSIGTMMGLFDSSQAAKEEGIVPVVIQTGDFKSTGFPGAPITDEQRAMLQGLADQSQKAFTAAIAARGLTESQIAEVTTAKVYPAAEGLRLGLIDGIKTEAEALAELQALISGSNGNETMTEKTAVASLADLEAACPGANSEFLLKQLKAGSSALDASRSYCETLRLELKAANEKIASIGQEKDDLQTQLTTLKATTGKHEAAPDKPADEDAADEESPMDGEDDVDCKTATARFNRKVQANMKAGMNRQKATQKAGREFPKLRQAMVEEVNAKK